VQAVPSSPSKIDDDTDGEPITEDDDGVLVIVACPSCGGIVRDAVSVSDEYFV
jgi:hypothetical protein